MPKALRVAVLLALLAAVCAGSLVETTTSADGARSSCQADCGYKTDAFSFPVTVDYTRTSGPQFTVFSFVVCAAPNANARPVSWSLRSNSKLQNDVELSPMGSFESGCNCFGGPTLTWQFDKQSDCQTYSLKVPQQDADLSDICQQNIKVEDAQGKGLFAQSTVEEGSCVAFLTMSDKQTGYITIASKQAGVSRQLLTTDFMESPEDMYLESLESPEFEAVVPPRPTSYGYGYGYGYAPRPYTPTPAPYGGSNVSGRRLLASEFMESPEDFYLESMESPEFEVISPQPRAYSYGYGYAPPPYSYRPTPGPSYTGGRRLLASEFMESPEEDMFLESVESPEYEVAPIMRPPPPSGYYPTPYGYGYGYNTPPPAYTGRRTLLQSTSSTFSTGPTYSPTYSYGYYSYGYGYPATTTTSRRNLLQFDEEDDEEFFAPNSRTLQQTTTYGYTPQPYGYGYAYGSYATPQIPTYTGRRSLLQTTTITYAYNPRPYGYGYGYSYGTYATTISTPRRHLLTVDLEDDEDEFIAPTPRTLLQSFTNTPRSYGYGYGYGYNYGYATPQPPTYTGRRSLLQATYTPRPTTYAYGPSYGYGYGYYAATTSTSGPRRHLLEFAEFDIEEEDEEEVLVAPVRSILQAGYGSGPSPYGYYSYGYYSTQPRPTYGGRRLMQAYAPVRYGYGYAYGAYSYGYSTSLRA